MFCCYCKYPPASGTEDTMNLSQCCQSVFSVRTVPLPAGVTVRLSE